MRETLREQRRERQKMQRKQKSDKRFVTKLLCDAYGALDHDYTSRGVEKTVVRQCGTREEYLRVINLLDEINRRGQYFYDPIEIVLCYIEDDKIVAEATRTEQIEKFESKFLETQLWVRYINGRRKP